MTKITLNNIESSKSEFDSLKGSIKGKCDLLASQVDELTKAIVELTKDKETETKAVELINIAQQITREKTREQFEQLVTYAIQYIFEDDMFKFALDFDRRGNMGTLDFNLQTPELQEKANILDTDSGGLINIVSLALRLVVIETMQPRNNGFLIFDESFKGLSEEFLPKAGQFLKAISAKLDRQIIMITHLDQLKIFADHTINV